MKENRQKSDIIRKQLPPAESLEWKTQKTKQNKQQQHRHNIFTDQNKRKQNHSRNFTQTCC